MAVDSRHLHHEEFSTRSEAEPLASLNELLEDLTPESRHCLQTLLQFDDQETLLAAFASSHFRSKVAKLTGLSSRQSELLACEIRAKVPQYLDV